MDYVEEHIWANTERGGDIWNGRWMPSVFEGLLPISPDLHITPADVQPALKSLQRLTSLLQWAQQAIYRARHIELMSKEAQRRRERMLVLRRRHKSKRAQTFYEAWRLPYFKPSSPRRRFAHPPPAQGPLHSTVHQRWLQYTRRPSKPQPLF